MAGDHLISRLALATIVSGDSPTADIATMSFQDVNLFQVIDMGGNKTVMRALSPSEKAAYENRFGRMQSAGASSMGVSGIHDDVDDADRMIGYIPYYIYDGAGGAQGEELIYAFFHKELARVVLLPADGPDARKTALGVINSAGVMHPLPQRYCANCGTQTAVRWKCRCERVRYCSRDCYRNHWPDHRPECAAEAAK
jgi:hypothetical protein